MINKANGVDYYLITYPRSGKHWTQWYLNNNTDLKYLSTHYVRVKNKKFLKEISALETLRLAMDNPQKIISTVRDPISCITSVNVMENFNHMEQRYYQYIDHYEYILNNHKFLFDFEDVKNNMQSIAKLLCEESNKNFKIQNENFDDYKEYHDLNRPKTHLFTSHSDERYKIALETVSKWNLKKHNDLYLEARNLCFRF